MQHQNMSLTINQLLRRSGSIRKHFPQVRRQLRSPHIYISHISSLLTTPLVIMKTPSVSIHTHAQNCDKSMPATDSAAKWQLYISNCYRAHFNTTNQPRANLPTCVSCKSVFATCVTNGRAYASRIHIWSTCFRNTKLGRTDTQRCNNYKI